jgi:NTP pyrophosphatase (non-canonical NTP hydrolase)
MSMTLGALQDRIRSLYGEKDGRRGVEGTFMWFLEEVGELSAALRGGTHEERLLEFADVLAWLATLANCVGVDLDAAMVAKYGRGCPGCGREPCICTDAYKP